MELISSASGTLVFLSLISLVFFVSRRSAWRSKNRRPPGPWRLPFVGSLFHLLTSQPQVALRDLASIHGPVMYLRLGQVDAVVISSPAAAHEVLREKDLSFASRPSILATEIFAYGNLDMAFAPYGAYWRALRKLFMVELLGARKVRQLASVRNAETLSLVTKVRAAGRGGRPVNLGRLLMACANEITGKSTFGQGCGGELQEQFLAVTDVALKIGGGFCVGDLFSALWFVDVLTGVRRRLWRAHRQMDAVIDKIIAQCEARRAASTTEDDDFLTVLLRIRDEGGLEFPIGTTNIKAIIADLFTAGTETTAATAEWVMTELIRNPEVMAKAQAEVRRTLDNKDPQDHEGHLDELRYTRLVIKESMRLHPVAPLLLPRVCRETCDVGGFEVAEGTRVIVNAWAMARSPEYWQDPEEFRPERFEGGDAPDYRGSRLEYLPFGTGRRMCPGDAFGLAVLELAVARLLYYFDWSLPAGMRPDELDMDMIVGISARRSNQLHLVASPYKVDVSLHGNAELI